MTDARSEFQTDGAAHRKEHFAKSVRANGWMSTNGTNCCWALNTANVHVVTNKVTLWQSRRITFFSKVENDLEVERRAGGRLFHARGPETANARSPIDVQRVGGTTRSEVDAERSWRRAALPTDTVRSDKWESNICMVRHHRHFVCDSYSRHLVGQFLTSSRCARLRVVVWSGASSRLHS